jgi:hypothetical protein
VRDHGVVERVELHTVLAGVVRVRAWACGHDGASDYRRVEVGHLADGRWWVRDSRQSGGAYVVGAERAARDLAAGWMSAGGSWRPTPARFDGHGQPADGLEWYRTGGTWLLVGRPPR